MTSSRAMRVGSHTVPSSASQARHDSRKITNGGLHTLQKSRPRWKKYASNWAVYSVQDI